MLRPTTCVGLYRRCAMQEQKVKVMGLGCQASRVDFERAWTFMIPRPAVDARLGLLRFTGRLFQRQHWNSCASSTT